MIIPCPAGHPAFIKYDQSLYFDDQKAWLIMCEDNYCSWIVEAATKEEAIEYWGKRADVFAPAGLRMITQHLAGQMNAHGIKLGQEFLYEGFHLKRNIWTISYGFKNGAPKLGELGYDLVKNGDDWLCYDGSVRFMYIHWSGNNWIPLSVAERFAMAPSNQNGWI